MERAVQLGWERFYQVIEKSMGLFDGTVPILVVLAPVAAVKDTDNVDISLTDFRLMWTNSLELVHKRIVIDTIKQSLDEGKFDRTNLP